MAFVKEAAAVAVNPAVKKFFALSAFAEYLKENKLAVKELGSKGNLVRVGAINAAGNVVAMYDGFKVAA